MKIHKKILTHYLSCTSPVDKEGYLYKQKERNASYQRRWFVLKANLLFYQERPADRRLLGVIILEGCAVRRCEADGGHCSFSLLFQAPGRKSYRFSAEDRPSQESWVTALLSASHCYLSLLVRDLGKQYEEAKQKQGCVGSLHPTSASGPTVKCLDQFVVPLLPSEEAIGSAMEGRSLGSSPVLQGPSSLPCKMANKKSPKLWPRRNAHVTPLNGPSPLYGEWPLVGLDPLEEFSKLHEYYGQEVLQVREEWLKTQQAKEERCHGDLIDLG